MYDMLRIGVSVFVVCKKHLFKWTSAREFNITHTVEIFTTLAISDFMIHEWQDVEKIKVISYTAILKWLPFNIFQMTITFHTKMFLFCF